MEDKELRTQMKTTPSEITVQEFLDLKKQQMLVVNSEYQRGVVWSPAQKKKLVDSVLRGYPLPLIYLHHIQQKAAHLSSERLEVIDGQQRINALSDFYEGAFKLFDPKLDAEEARFPEFITRAPCEWGRKGYPDLSDELKSRFLSTRLHVVQIETHDSNEARDLFVRLQSGIPLSSQEKRDAWPGQFTDFVLRLGGKPGIARYPGNDFFNVLGRGQKIKDRGKLRQLAAQIAVLFFSRQRGKGYCDINAKALDDFYYENLGFDAESQEAKRLLDVLEKVTKLLAGNKLPRLQGHELIHLVLLVDTLMDDYTRAWEPKFFDAFEDFRQKFAQDKADRLHNPREYWLQYGVGTRVNSDTAVVIVARHEFFCKKMQLILQAQPKDPKRTFGALERELIYSRDGKRCGVCQKEVPWAEVDIHHVDEHAKGGRTLLDNGALVHRGCHPKGPAALEFAKTWKVSASPSLAEDDSEEDDGDD